MRIIFFASGDFAIPTFKNLIETSTHEIVGLVTSNDKVFYNEKRLYDIAKENNIPTYIPSDLESDDFIEWLKGLESDVFCVISYKKLPQKVLEVVHGNAFNVHASYLPFLRGAAPISWALRLGFKETGLSSFILNDKIDQGNIILQKIVSILEDDNYDSLFQRLSLRCVDLTFETLSLITSNETLSFGLSYNQQINIGVDSALLKAPKITDKYFSSLTYEETMGGFMGFFRSIPYKKGLPCVFIVCTRDDETKKIIHREKINCKVFAGELVNIGCWQDWWCSTIKTDGKMYLCFHSDPIMKSNQMFSITEIQLAGKKKMNIREFLRGFKYFDKDKYITNLQIGK